MEKEETQLIHRVTHFTFQLCRKTLLYPLDNQLNDLLYSLKGYLLISEYQAEKNKYLDLLCFLFKLIVYTRDIYDGKGERDLTYNMIMVWYKHFPSLAMYIFEKICSKFGSWKDAKYLCHFIKHNANHFLSEEKQEKCLENIIQIMNTQLHNDITNRNNLSLIAKWIPREKSKFGWLYECLVKNWNQKEKEKTYQPSYKIYKKYRKILTSLNRKIDTPQIKQCERKSHEIDYYHVSLITKRKNTDYFLQNPTKYQSPSNQKRRSDFSRESNRAKPILNYDIGELYRENENNQTKNDNINILLWERIREDINSRLETNQEKYLLPILDMTSNNIEDGIAISILLSEISEISNRILTYDQKQAIWISLENQLSLHDKKRQIQKHTILSLNPAHHVGALNDKRYKTRNQKQNQTNHSTNAIKCIINSILETKLPLDKIEGMYLVFISDFAWLDKEYDHISVLKGMFRENGISKIPNIIYWNISTEIVSILPCSPTTPNIIFLAGTASSNFHHLFEFSKRSDKNEEVSKRSDKNEEVSKRSDQTDQTDTTDQSDTINPFSYYNKILNQEKYQPFEKYLRTVYR